MSEAFLGEIKAVAFGFAPRGWALCNGQLLPINQNQALFSLLGTTYGGDGRVTFALPDLRGRAAMHFGAQTAQGQRAGAEAHTLTATELPPHAHGGRLMASADIATSTDPAGKTFAARGRGGAVIYAPPPVNTALAPGALSTTGGAQPHPNMQPYLTISFVIALQGIFPSRD